MILDTLRTLKPTNFVCRLHVACLVESGIATMSQKISACYGQFLHICRRISRRSDKTSHNLLARFLKYVPECIRVHCVGSALESPVSWTSQLCLSRNGKPKTRTNSSSSSVGCDHSLDPRQNFVQNFVTYLSSHPVAKSPTQKYIESVNHARGRRVTTSPHPKLPLSGPSTAISAPFLAKKESLKRSKSAHERQDRRFQAG